VDVDDRLAGFDPGFQKMLAKQRFTSPRNTLHEIGSPPDVSAVEEFVELGNPGVDRLDLVGAGGGCILCHCLIGCG